VSRPALLALDGGGSKIDAVLLARSGQVLGAVRCAVSFEDGHNGARQSEISLAAAGAAVAAVCTDADMDPRAIPIADFGMYCLAGADLPADDRRIERALKRRMWTATNAVRNDTFAVLRAGSDRSWGIAVVCGYGMNCSGVAPTGRKLRFPAVGSISGDWGGGFDIGSAALWHALRARDGRGADTQLAKLVPLHFGMQSPRKVMEAIYFGRLREQRLVELPPVVFRAAAGGDKVARSIVDRQADEVVRMAGAAIRRLKLADHDVDVVLGGGVFLSTDALFFDRIEHGLQAIAHDVRIEVLSAPPVVGAALLGLDQIGASKRAVRRVRADLTHERLKPKAGKKAMQQVSRQH
jgi:N-acetylglucosamine kinase-like BadF-type ATPase